MAETGTARSVSRRRASEAAEPQELPDYCARPACRQPFTRVVGPGRPQAFCSEICRRTAEKEVRQLRSRLSHFEGLVQQLRVDLSAFNRGIDAQDEGAAVDDESRRQAENAVMRAGGVLSFVDDSANALAAELRQLYDAVAPVILAG